MANSSLLTKAAKSLDRTSLLRRLDVPESFPLVGDFPNCAPINLDTASNLRIDASDVHVLNFGTDAGRCSGVRLVRFHRKTTAVSCFAEPNGHEGGGAFCEHCLQLWSFADDKGVYRLVKRKMMLRPLKSQNQPTSAIDAPNKNDMNGPASSQPPTPPNTFPAVPKTP